MNTKQFFIICSMLTVLAACSESDPFLESEYNSTYLYVDISSINDEEGSFYVNSNRSWRVSDSPYWVNLDHSFGYSSRTINYTLDDNTSSSIRYGTIKIVTDNGMDCDVIDVTQDPTVAFSASMSTTYSGEGDYHYLFVTASKNREWTVTKSVSWVHLYYSSNTYSTYTGKGSESVCIYVDANPYSYQRSTTLTVKCGTQSKNITITQEAKPNYTTFSSWTSTNKTNSSTSYKEYTLSVSSGNVLSFKYDISSEAGYDEFTAILLRNGYTYTTLVNGDSGVKSSQSVSYTFYTSGTFTLKLQYKKDGSGSSGQDKVYVYDIKLKK